MASSPIVRPRSCQTVTGTSAVNVQSAAGQFGAHDRTPRPDRRVPPLETQVAGSPSVVSRQARSVRAARRVSAGAPRAIDLAVEARRTPAGSIDRPTRSAGPAQTFSIPTNSATCPIGRTLENVGRTLPSAARRPPISSARHSRRGGGPRRDRASPTPSSAWSPKRSPQSPPATPRASERLRPQTARPATAPPAATQTLWPG